MTHEDIRSTHSILYREGLRAKKRVTKLVLAVTGVFIGIKLVCINEIHLIHPLLSLLGSNSHCFRQKVLLLGQLGESIRQADTPGGSYDHMTNQTILRN